MLESDVGQEALRGLAGQRYSIADAARHVPNVAGLYAIYAETSVWNELGIDRRGEGTPLYVGKSESSLVVRELKTHFAIDDGAAIKTGGSTVRRSFAALLREAQGFRGQPRDAAMNPKYFASFSLAHEDDRRLTAWMHQNLTLAVWAKPADLSLPLRDVEAVVLTHWMPPLNIQGVPNPLRRLRAARSRMQADAEQWARAHAERASDIAMHDDVSAGLDSFSA
ncbi:GIY-YIG nuclease family protein [Mycetocola zhadangensis]|uniref:GIY-YIG nuclease family protein n=1 Tax=Mycetocola zhadangensis TaxID=1164595 RepID=UPI003A4D84E4